MFPEFAKFLADPSHFSLVISGVVALGIAAQWLAWYLKQPSIIFLLAIGVLVGPVLGLFDPNQVLGDILFPFISLGVAVILFEGSLTLQFHELKSHGKVVQKLVSLGVVISIALISLVAYLLFEMDWKIALLFGALVCVTGPTVIIPMLRSVRPNKTISNILKWEGIIIDPIGAIAVVLVYEFILSGGSNNPLLLFGGIVLLGMVLGLLGAAFIAFVVKRHLLPEYLKNVFILAFVLFVFALSNYIEHESGLLTVTVMGVALANWPKFPKDEVLHFNESLSVLLISVLFIVLAARVELESLYAVGMAGVVLLAVVMLVARPAAVWASAHKSTLTFNEKAMISWIGPRGIVAAAISSLFAIKLTELNQKPEFNLTGVELLVPLVFLIIAGTVIIQSLGAKFVGNLLKVREPAANGVLLIGSNAVALRVAKALKEQNFDVLIAHNNYTNISKARMEGIRCYYGNPISEHAEINLDLIGIGHMFAMSVDQELNSLSEMHFKHEFGENSVYRLQFTENAKNNREKKQKNFRSHWLFGKDITYAKLASMVAKDARVKVTKITENYTYSQYRADNTSFIPLFYIDNRNVLHVISAVHNNVPNDVKLISLVVKDEKAAEAKTAKALKDREHKEKIKEEKAKHSEAENGNTKNGNSQDGKAKDSKTKDANTKDSSTKNTDTKSDTAT